LFLDWPDELLVVAFEVLGAVAESHLLAVVADSHGREVLVPARRNGNVPADYFAVLDDQKGALVAIDSNTDIVALFELFRRQDSSDLECRILYLPLVEEELTPEVAEGVVGLSDCELVRVILGDQSYVDGVLGCHSQHLGLEIRKAEVVLQRRLRLNDLRSAHWY
jgi:hypothetical protein